MASRVTISQNGTRDRGYGTSKKTRRAGGY